MRERLSILFAIHYWTVLHSENLSEGDIVVSYLYQGRIHRDYYNIIMLPFPCGSISQYVDMTIMFYFSIFVWYHLLLCRIIGRCDVFLSFSVLVRRLWTLIFSAYCARMYCWRALMCLCCKVCTGFICSVWCWTSNYRFSCIALHASFFLANMLTASFCLVSVVKGLIVSFACVALGC